MDYCARSDVYALGLAPEAFRRPARDVEGVVPSTGVMTLRSHGLAANAPVTLAVDSSSVYGAPAAATPAGSSVGTLYYALPLSSDLFKIATTPNGSPLTFSDGGAGVFGILVDHGVYLDGAIAAASALIDQYATAHAAPIAAAILPLICAFLAARIYATAHAAMSPMFQQALEAPSWLRGLIDTLFRVWLTGAPIKGSVDATPTIAETGAVLVALAPGDFDLARGGIDIA